MSSETAKASDTITVSVDVRNSGKLNGDEVVQLYVRDLTSKEPQPIRSLKGFKRVHILKGESQTVEIPLPVKSFRYFNEKKDQYVVEPGKYELQIGSSSGDIKLKGVVTVTE